MGSSIAKANPEAQLVESGTSVVNNAISSGTTKHGLDVTLAIVLGVAILLFLGFISILIYFLIKKSKKKSSKKKK